MVKVIASVILFSCGAPAAPTPVLPPPAPRATPTPAPQPTATPAGTGSGSSGRTPGPEPTEVSMLAAVDREIARLEKANIAFNNPDNLQLGESSTIQLLLSTQESIPGLQGQIEAPGPTEGAEIKVSSTMRASLTGSGFLIRPISKEVQPITGYEKTEWQWEIIPNRTGVQRLRLTLSALISVEGTERDRFIKTFDRDIDVRVDEILKPLREAKVTFDPPKAVQLGESLPVELLVSPQGPVGVANRIEASLTGSGFVVQPITTGVQSVSEIGQAEW